ncbi:hypothetical protein NKR23_g6089 [Pleurostoma richardsiae]|uniref:Uncharacterized protein n=1 Tax=Pleurostoma richardsiae TaxID=41990 RepID=A0AA38S041_9PEZI|nr:hypothetical protein NKR23_g6089 [Pleurostoma richardsiae]
MIVAGIGGGVGGGIAASRSTDDRNALTSAVSSSSRTSTTAASTTSSTVSSAAATPTYLNNQTGPVGFAFQGFSDRNFSGTATEVYLAEGFTDLPYNCSSYVWLPNGTSCCVTFCRNETASVGWWCQARKQPSASSAFERIFVGCGDLASQAESRCS